MASIERGTTSRCEYVPQCYFAGFSRGRGRKSELYVVDSTTGQAFVRAYRDIAAGFTHNRSETTGEIAALIGSGYTEFESKLGAALMRTDVKGDFADHTDRALVLKLVALLAVRNRLHAPPARQPNEQEIRKVLAQAVADRQHWESQRNKIIRAGVDGAAALTFEEVRKLVERGDYKISLPATEYVQREHESLATVYRLLHERRWIVATAAAGSGGFATSDHPVTLFWDDRDMDGGLYPPAIGLRNTSVFFPLSKRLTLRGRFAGTVDAVKLDTDAVAALNSRTIFYADRQIYAESSEFRFLDRNLIMRFGRDLPTLL